MKKEGVMLKKILLFAVAVALMTGTAQAAVIYYSATAPEIGPDDPHFLGESINDETNVANGSGASSAENDHATYIAHDRTGLGQTFTTGPDPTGYVMSGFWMKNVMYETCPSNGTWWYVDNDGDPLGGSQLELRVVDPAYEGDVGGSFVVHSEVYTVTGTEPNNGLFPVNWDPDKLGTGTWVYFGFDTSVQLAPNTQYGFDVTVVLADWGYFFETAGVDYGSYIGGSAYSTGTANGTNSLFLEEVYADGDHTFVVELVPEPATIALLGLGGLVLIRRKRS